MATLRDILLAPETQPKVIDDGLALVDEQISDKSGISGAAVKIAYKAVVTFSPDHIRYMVEQLMPGMLDKLEPYWQHFQASGGGSFGDYLAKNGEQASESLLEDHRCPRRGLQPADNREGLQVGAWRRGEECPGRPARTGCARPEVRGLARARSRRGLARSPTHSAPVPFACPQPNLATRPDLRPRRDIVALRRDYRSL